MQATSPHSLVDRSEKSDCLARFTRGGRQQHVEDQVDQLHQAHLITASKDNVPTPIRVNKTYRRRLTENRHMSMRTVASVQLKYKRVPQNWEKTAKQGTL